MSVTFKQVRSGLDRFRRANRGGVATIFALSITPVVFLSLVMIDYSRASTARANMQQVLDATALLVARSTAITDGDLKKVGEPAFDAQMPSNLGIATTIKTFNNGAGNTIVAHAEGAVTPLVAGLFLGGPIKISADSQVVRSMNKLEIAMVLDTTGSMKGDKINNLKVAAKNFIDTMAAASARGVQTNPSVPEPVKISIVPFSNTVKISAPVDLKSYSTPNFPKNGLPDWLDGRAQSTPYNLDIFNNASAAPKDRTDRFLMLHQMKSSWGGCVENRAPPYDVTDDPPLVPAATDSADVVQAKVQSLFTPYFWPDESDTYSGGISFGSSQNNYLSDGYSGLSLLNLLKLLTSWLVPQGNSAKYTTAPRSGTNPAGFTYGPNSGCSMQQMQPLSNSFATMKTTVDGLVAGGETNIPIGLAWGWHSISPNLPLGGGQDGPAAYGTKNLTKIVVLMTDGQNTEDPVSDSNSSLYHGYGFVWQNRLGLGGDSKANPSSIMTKAKATSSGTRTKALDARMQLLCDNIKAKGIVIYTVGVGVSDSSKELLEKCATTPGQYYDVNSSGSNMNAAFSAIAGSIQNLRISQ